MGAKPSVYYLTDHYVNYPMVLMRLSRIDRNSLRNLWGLAWSFVNSPMKKKGRRVGSQRRKATE